MDDDLITVVESEDSKAAGDHMDSIKAFYIKTLIEAYFNGISIDKFLAISKALKSHMKGDTLNQIFEKISRGDITKDELAAFIDNISLEKNKLS